MEVHHSELRSNGAFAAITLLAFVTSHAALRAEDKFAVQSVASIEVVSGTRPSDKPGIVWPHLIGRGSPPLITLVGSGDVFLGANHINGAGDDDRSLWIAVRVPASRDVEGVVFIPRFDGLKQGESFRFRISASKFTNSDREAYWRIRRDHYRSLFAEELAGSAWFRRREREAAAELGVLATEQAAARADRRAPTSQVESTFSLLSGGRAVSENLQLDRHLPESKPTEPTVPLASIRGIQVPDYDWTAQIKDLPEPQEPLAAALPGDQHAVLCPSFASFLETLDWASEHGGVVADLVESRAEDAGSQDRYPRQLGLPLGAVERLLGKQVVQQVAITGGDPYFRTGTDIAILLKSSSAELLWQTLRARLDQARTEYPDAEGASGELSGVAYYSARTPDRRLCSHVARMGDVLVVTNSLDQLARLIAVSRQEVPSLQQQPEFRFFRGRYRTSEEGELAFVILTDQTIRRWCGPKWRIAEARRIRSAAVVADAQAQRAESLIQGQVVPGPLQQEYWISDGDSLVVRKEGVASTMYGDLGFQTPIGELKFDQVTEEEARLYQRWRDGYQANWSTYFDPIAVQLVRRDGRITIDMSVMPLIVKSEYRQFMEITRGAKIGMSADPHAESLLHVAMAVNPESRTLKGYVDFAAAFAPQVKVNPLSWVGNSISIYAEKDPIWAELAKTQGANNRSELSWLSELHRLPIAFRAEVSNPLKLTGFLVGLRAFLEQTAPGMTTWETREHQGISYVKITPTNQALQNVENQETYREAALYYVATGEAWVVSPQEKVIQRSIERSLARKAKDAAGEGEPPQKASPSPWAGESLAATLDMPLDQVLKMAWSGDYQRAMQRNAWANLPILNEWKRLFPDQDPVAVHQRLWHRRLACPSGQPYRWNPEAGTMESTIFGHPGEPRRPEQLAWPLSGYKSAAFGITFEDQGLRTRVELKE